MFIEASSIEDLITKSGKFEDVIRQLDEFIQNTAPNLERKFCNTQTISGIGYGKMPEQYQTDWGFWPLISLAPQKNNVSIYITARKERKFLPELYKDKLGKVSLGKSCIRVTKFKNLNLEEFENLIRDAIVWCEMENKDNKKRRNNNDNNQPIR